MKKLLLVAALASLLAPRVEAQVVCTINETLGCFSGGGGIAAGDNTAFTGNNTFSGTSDFSGLATFTATPTAASFLSQFLIEQESAPAAPSAALAGAGAGNVDDGTHLYAVTCVDDVGETTIGTASSEFTMVDKSTDGQVSLTSIAVCVSGQTASRIVYRTAAGTTTPFKVLTTLSDNTTTTYTDNTADAGLGANSPASNTTAVRLSFEGTADAFEARIAVADPFADTWFTIGPSPDGNPWAGAGAGVSAAAVDVRNLYLGRNAGTASSGTSTDNFCAGDLACDTLVSGDGNQVVGAGSDVFSATTSNATVFGFGAIGGDTGVSLGHLSAAASGTVSVGSQAGKASGANDSNNLFGGHQSGLLAGGGGNVSLNNVCLGAFACDVLLSGDRIVTVGANSDVGTNSDSDATIIGESMVGKGSDTYLDGYGGRERCFTQGTGKALTESTPTAFVRVSVATESYTGAWIRWRVLADDGTDFQSLSGESVIDVVNKADAETCTIRTLPAFGAAVEAASAGTLALEADPACATAAASSVDVSLDAVSSLTQTSLNAFYTICVDGPATTITPQ